MKISRAGEFAAIEMIKGICRKAGREVLTGIGDDAAAFRAAEGKLTLVSTDMLVEGVHFDLSYTGFKDLGYKALAANLSDIAAMGGRPRYYLVALAVSGRTEMADVERLYRGMESLAEGFGVKAIGGDTCSSGGPMVISVTVIGETVSKKAVSRAGARPGDDIYVTGTLGDSAGGLELLKSGGDVKEGSPEAGLVARHLLPTPKVKVGRWLAENGLASAMIDISDGFSSDLGHILHESGVGAEVEADRLPVSSELSGVFGPRKAAALALHGGEDYELLFTAGQADRDKIKGRARRLGTPFTLVGTVTRGKGAFLVSGDGKRKTLSPKGYEHFRG